MNAEVTKGMKERRDMARYGPPPTTIKLIVPAMADADD